MALTDEEIIIIEHLLIQDEGIRLLPYFDCCGKFFRKCFCAKQGKLTIGIGRNIEDIGITELESIELVRNDVIDITRKVERSFSWFKDLNTPRKIVILSMVFNLGLDGFKEFKKMIKCIESGDFASAANHALDSKWHIQVKDRAKRLALILEKGQF